MLVLFKLSCIKVNVKFFHSDLVMRVLKSRADICDKKYCRCIRVRTVLFFDLIIVSLGFSGWFEI